MHFPCLVIGDDVDEQLGPYAESLEVERYQRFLDDSEVAMMADHLAVDARDTQALAARMREWVEEEGGVDDGRLFAWSTANPSAKYDFYRVGGRFAGYLQLKEPRRPGILRRLFGAGSTTGVSRARRTEVDENMLRKEPPAAIVIGGRWHECPIGADQAATEAWRAEFGALLDAADPDALLTVVDIHS